MASAAPSLRTVPGASSRVLALDLRPRKAGFVVLHGNILLDWGVRAYGSSGARLEIPVQQRLNALLNLHSPACIIVQRRNIGAPTVARALAVIMRIVKTEARRHAIDLEVVNAVDVRHFFVKLGCRNKHEIASRIASWFEELAWKLPPKRKPWQSEDHNMTIFDAAAIATTFLWNESDEATHR